MNESMKTLLNRRSVRSFRPEQLREEDLAAILKAGTYAPSAMGKQPACLLFSKPIDSLAASGAILAAIWTDAVMPVVDCLGQEFLDYMRDGMAVSVAADGTVTVDDGGEGEAV